MQSRFSDTLFSDKSRFSDNFVEDQKFNATIKNSLSGPTLHNLLRTRKKRHIIVAKAREMHSTYNIGFHNGVTLFLEVKF